VQLVDILNPSSRSPITRDRPQRSHQSTHDTRLLPKHILETTFSSYNTIFSPRNTSLQNARLRQYKSMGDYLLRCKLFIMAIMDLLVGRLCRQRNFRPECSYQSLGGQTRRESHDLMSVRIRRHIEKNGLVRTARFPLHYEVWLAKGNRVLRGGVVGQFGSRSSFLSFCTRSPSSSISQNTALECDRSDVCAAYSEMNVSRYGLRSACVDSDVQANSQTDTSILLYMSLTRSMRLLGLEIIPDE
jgi:hypothetical protein